MDTGVVDQNAGPTGSTQWSRARTLVTLAVVAALVVSGLALRSVLVARANRPPYPADAVHASVRMELVAPEQAQAAADRLAGPGRLIVPFVESVGGRPVQQQVVGQLTFRTPANAPSGGQYALFVIDRRQGRSVTAMYGTGPVGTNVGQGWDGRFNKVAAKYPWLQMLADVRTPDGSGFTNSGMSVDFAPDTAGPVTFVALLDADSLPITDPAQQLTVALVFIGANDHVYWATKLAG